MKTCEQIEEWMDWQMAGWADAEQVQAVEAHVAECETCREQARLMGILGEALAEGDVPEMPTVQVESAAAPRTGSHWVAWGAVAACAMIAFVVTRNPQSVEVAAVPSPVEALSDAPPTWATYSRATALLDDDLLTVLEAHDQNLDIYEPPITLLAMRGELEGLLK